MNIPKGTIIEITISVRAENACEVETENIGGIGETALDALLDSYPDLSRRSNGYRIDRRRKLRINRRRAGDRQRMTEIPEPPAGGKIQ